MKTASSSSRINAVSAVKISIEGTWPDSMIAVHIALLHKEKDESPVLMGRETLAATWPDNVRKLAGELHSAIEDHLLQVYFINERKSADGDGREYPIDVPAGLGGSGLGSPEDEPEAL